MQPIESTNYFEFMCAQLGADIPQLFAQVNTPIRRYVSVDANGAKPGPVAVVEPTSVERYRALIASALKDYYPPVAAPAKWEAEQILENVIKLLYAASEGYEELRGEYLKQAKSDLRYLRVNYSDLLPDLLARVGVMEVV